MEDNGVLDRVLRSVFLMGFLEKDRGVLVEDNGVPDRVPCGG